MQWQKVQNKYAREINKNQDKRQWAKKAQLFVWQYTKEAWNFQNKAVYGENGLMEGKWKTRMYKIANEIKVSDPQVGYRAKHLLNTD